MKLKRFRITRTTAAVIAAIAIAGTAVVVGVSSFSDTGSDFSSIYHDTAARQQYQLGLNHSPDRVSSRIPTVKDGHVYVAQGVNGYSDWMDPCEYRCATVTPIGKDGYNMSLPVGFTYQPGTYQLTNDTVHYTAVQVKTLTFWNPVSHQEQTVRAYGNQSVLLPAVLQRQTVQSLRVGQVGFTDLTDTVQTSGGNVYVYDFAEVALEPSAVLYSGGSSLNVPITRTNTGLVMCLGTGNYPFAYEAQPRTVDQELLLVKVVTDC